MQTVRARVSFGLLEKRVLFTTLSNFVQMWDRPTCRAQHWQPHYTKHLAEHQPRPQKGWNAILKADVFAVDSSAILPENALALESIHERLLPSHPR